MQFYVISGGPGTGKTKLLGELEKNLDYIGGIDYFILKEAARNVAGSDPRFVGKSIKEINMSYFQPAVFEHQKRDLEIMKNKLSFDIVFSERSFGDTLAYMKIYEIPIHRKHIGYFRNNEFSKVFILDYPKKYKQDELRQESKEEARIIHEEIIKVYNQFEFKPIFVPLFSDIEKDSLEKRSGFILNQIGIFKN
ncbi:MAG: ATP-binding protein [Nanoarchaeota archaeon]|nr:ATP-binding protein [Nanoarchaeota archaeon]MBU1027646.1 ATP-binding protein [Nanoarchaeota archaeon]